MFNPGDKIRCHTTFNNSLGCVYKANQWYEISIASEILCPGAEAGMYTGLKSVNGYKYFDHTAKEAKNRPRYAKWEHA